MAKNPPFFFVLFLACTVLSTGCNLGRSEITHEVPVSQETVVPLVTEGLPASGSETPVPSAIPEATSPPVLERPGLKVVYTSAGNLLLWTENGKMQLTSSGNAYSPQISPDGQVVAFLRPADDFHLELWAINTDGTNERRLVSISDLDTIGGGVRDPNAVAINPYHYEWVPGSHSLAFNTQQVFQGPGLSLLDDLNLVNADSLEIKYLLLSGWGGEFVYSPDGNRIAISNPNSIILCKADGSDYRSVLTYEPVNTYSEYRFYATPVWSPDATFLRVAIPPADPLSDPPLPTNLWMIPTNGSPAFQQGSLMAVPFYEQPVAFAPDLSRLIYLREVGVPAENRRELHLAAFDGSGDWVYSEYALLHFFDWSVDSRAFSFSVGEDQEAWLGSLKSSPVLLAPDAYGVMDLRWVDTRNLLYVQQRSEVFEIYLAAMGGGASLLDTIPDSLPAYDYAYP